MQRVEPLGMFGFMSPATRLVHSAHTASSPIQIKGTRRGSDRKMTLKDKTAFSSDLTFKGAPTAEVRE